MQYRPLVLALGFGLATFACACDRRALDERTDGAGTLDASPAATPGGASDGGAPSDGVSPIPGFGSIDARPLGPLETELQGWWQTSTVVGNCVEGSTYLHVLPAGAAETVLVDDNACQAELRGTFVFPANWMLSGSRLTLFQTYRSGSSSNEEYDVAVGFQGQRRTLYYNVYIPIDVVTWRRTPTTQWFNADGMASSRSVGTTELRFDAPLPTRGEGTCAAEVTLISDGLTWSLRTASCEYHPDGNLQQLRLQPETAGLSPDEAQLLQSRFGGWLMFAPGERPYIFESGWPAVDGPPQRPTP